MIRICLHEPPQLATTMTIFNHEVLLSDSYAALQNDVGFSTTIEQVVEKRLVKREQYCNEIQNSRKIICTL